MKSCETVGVDRAGAWLFAWSCFVLGLNISCRTRTWDEDGASVALEGKIDPQAPSAEVAQANGHFQINCTPVPIETEFGPKRQGKEYVFDVTGAVSPTDEVQPLILTIERIAQDGVRSTDVKQARGRGAISIGHSIFLAFAQGALTSSQADGQAMQQGLMTLAADGTGGIEVSCGVVAIP